MTYYKSKEGGTDPEVVVSPGSSRTKYLPRIYVNEELKTLAGSSHSINKNILKTNQGKKKQWADLAVTSRTIGKIFMSLHAPGISNPPAPRAL